MTKPGHQTSEPKKHTDWERNKFFSVDSFEGEDVGNVDYTSSEFTRSTPETESHISSTPNGFMGQEKLAIFDPMAYKDQPNQPKRRSDTFLSRSESGRDGNLWSDFGVGFGGDGVGQIQHNFESMMMKFDSKKISGFHEKSAKDTNGKLKAVKRKRKVVNTGKEKPIKNRICLQILI